MSITALLDRMTRRCDGCPAKATTTAQRGGSTLRLCKHHAAVIVRDGWTIEND